MPVDWILDSALFGPGYIGFLPVELDYPIDEYLFLFLFHYRDFLLFLLNVILNWYFASSDYSTMSEGKAYLVYVGLRSGFDKTSYKD